jgi:hypothetical protein
MRLRATAMGKAFAVALVSYILASLLPGVFIDGKVNIHCSRDEHGRLVVDLEPNWRVNGICRVEFWLEGGEEYLWVVEERDVPFERIVYGWPPTGARQQLPKDNVPPAPLPSEGVLYIAVDFQWDKPIPPTPIGDNIVLRVLLTANGSAQPIGYDNSPMRPPWTCN